MLALVYLFIMVALGDAICRRFYAFVSLPHRFAAAFLSGLIISSWWTYGAAWLFSGFSSPMLWGNLVYFITAIGLILWFRQMPQKSEPRLGVDLGKTEFEKWDWVIVGLCFLFACWMMFATFNTTDGQLQIAHHQWSDFGSNVSIMQSFALGNNFPTEYPHFSGERIHYHFLYYFQAGNLEYLGLNPAMSNNILSILSLVSMLVLVMTLGVVVFSSKVVGRIAAAVFFFHGSLSFLPFLYSRGWSNAWTGVTTMRDFLPSGFPYRGELWGVWSQVVFINQRHLASSVGIFLVVLIFLFLRYREVSGPGETLLAFLTRKKEIAPPAEPVTEQEESVDTVEEQSAPPAGAEEAPEPEPEKPKRAKRGSRKSAKESTDLGDIQEFAVKSDESGDETESSDVTPEPPASVDEAKIDPETVSTPPPHTSVFALLGAPLGRIWPWVFSGLLLGLMPMWNGAIFTAAAAVLAALLVLFPLRRQMIILALTAGIVAIPQIIFLKTGNMVPGPSLLHWGYVIDDPTLFNVLWYVIFTFGFKWVLIGIALLIATAFQWRFFIAISILFVVTFCFQFSNELLANHKFFNVWLIMANLFVAAGLWWLWNRRVWKTALFARLGSLVLIVLITLGGIIDLFPIRNSFWMTMGFADDAVVKWVTKETDPKAIFLSFRYVNHPILLAGRRLFFGHPYYAWGANYPTYERDAIWRRMLENTNPQEVFRLLKENNISYVAIDNGLRGDVKNINEAVYQAYFQKVFDDTENKHGNLKIYQVPAALGAPNPNVELPPGSDPAALPVVGANAFTGGSGSLAGQFNQPRGLAADGKGNIYVADTGNDRIQKFDAEGKYLSAFGKSGTGEGEMREPNGVAIDTAGNVYVTDAVTHKLMKFNADGVFVKEWKGPDPALYGPRDIAFGPNKQLYIVDQGRTRIVKFDPATEKFGEWGTRGDGEGQFLQSTGIGIGGGFVFVADNGNNRIQAFDLDGKFIRQWEVVPWQRYVWNYPDIVVDESSKRLYVTDPWKNEILAFDLDGNQIETGLDVEAGRFDNPTALCITEANKKRRLLVLNTGGNRISAFALEAKPPVK